MKRQQHHALSARETPDSQQDISLDSLESMSQDLLEAWNQGRMMAERTSGRSAAKASRMYPGRATRCAGRG
jgi:hypothetical protein